MTVIVGNHARQRWSHRFKGEDLDASLTRATPVSESKVRRGCAAIYGLTPAKRSDPEDAVYLYDKRLRAVWVLIPQGQGWFAKTVYSVAL